MRRNRTMVGFVDLTLILLGSVALIGELRQHDLRISQAIVRPRQAGEAEKVQVAISRLFEPNEARLSVQGASWVRLLASRAEGRSIGIHVALDAQQGSARLGSWEEAAARTASIMYALQADGYPATQIAPAMPQDDSPAGHITFALGK